MKVGLVVIENIGKGIMRDDILRGGSELWDDEEDGGRYRKPRKKSQDELYDEREEWKEWQKERGTKGRKPVDENRRPRRRDDEAEL